MRFANTDDDDKGQESLRSELQTHFGDVTVLFAVSIRGQPMAMFSGYKIQTTKLPSSGDRELGPAKSLSSTFYGGEAETRMGALQNLAAAVSKDNCERVTLVPEEKWKSPEVFLPFGVKGHPIEIEDPQESGSGPQAGYNM